MHEHKKDDGKKENERDDIEFEGGEEAQTDRYS